MALERMLELHADLVGRNKNRAAEEEDVDLTTPLMIEDTEKSVAPVTYLDPPMSQCKGRKKKACRFKPTVEVKAKIRRTCSYCHTKQGQNLRSCPKRLRDLNKGKKQLETVVDETEEEDDMSSEESTL